MLTIDKPMTTKEVSMRFNELAQQEKWFEIQDELFSAGVTSADPINSPYMGLAAGKDAVRKKGEEFVKAITGVHHMFTSEPIVTGNHFAVSREMDITHQKFGRIQINEIMLYEVSNGKIISERFFY